MWKMRSALRELEKSLVFCQQTVCLALPTGAALGFSLGSSPNPKQMFSEPNPSHTGRSREVWGHGDGDTETPPAPERQCVDKGTSSLRKRLPRVHLSHSELSFPKQNLNMLRKCCQERPFYNLFHLLESKEETDGVTWNPWAADWGRGKQSGRGKQRGRGSLGLDEK